MPPRSAKRQAGIARWEILAVLCGVFISIILWHSFFIWNNYKPIFLGIEDSAGSRIASVSASILIAYPSDKYSFVRTVVNQFPTIIQIIRFSVKDDLLSWSKREITHDIPFPAVVGEKWQFGFNS